MMQLLVISLLLPPAATTPLPSARIDWVSGLTNANETLWVSGTGLDEVDAKLCRSARLATSVDSATQWQRRECVTFDNRSNPDLFQRWPSQMRVRVPSGWTGNQDAVVLQLQAASRTPPRIIAETTLNSPTVHWWIADASVALDSRSSQQLGTVGRFVRPGGTTRIFGKSLAMGDDGLCIDPLHPRLGESNTTLRLGLTCSQTYDDKSVNLSHSLELVAAREDCYSAEFHVPSALPHALHGDNWNCSLKLSRNGQVSSVSLDGILQLYGMLDPRRSVHRVQAGNVSEFQRVLLQLGTQALCSSSSRTGVTPNSTLCRDRVVRVELMGGVYHMPTNVSLSVPDGVIITTTSEASSGAELLYDGSPQFLPAGRCMLGNLGADAPGWTLGPGITVTVASNISCNTANGVDTPANAIVCLGGHGSAVVGAVVRTIRQTGFRFCHLVHASGGRGLSVHSSSFRLAMDSSHESLPRVFSVDNCSDVVVANNFMYTDAEGWIISSSHRVVFADNRCNSSVSDGSHGNTLGTYHPPARLDDIFIGRNQIVNQGTTMDGPGQSWNPLWAVPNASLGYYGGARVVTSAGQNAATMIELTGGHNGSTSGNGILRAAALYEGMGVAVMQGSGVEQLRRVVSAQAGTRMLMLDRPFDVAIDNSTIVALTLYRHHVAVVGNSFSTQLHDVAFWVYGGCSDCIISANVASGPAPNSTHFGMGLWPRSIHAMIEPVHRTEFQDNQVTNFGSVGLIGGLETYLPSLRDCTLASARSVVIRRNFVRGGTLQVSMTPLDDKGRFYGLIGGLLEGNSVVNRSGTLMMTANSSLRLTVRKNQCNGGLCL